ncbi:peptidoglycan-binding domain 1 protein [Oceanimonas sp. GK1]|uniref:ExeA family protein n=1 Tax=Oceanimonas sp. (strain GK1 / IBRC-M 10197) TaxID=511062 RepID=UPI0002494B20|nr:ExeA family protein [Oceanimonas sp. GK1]AEY00194.1 peptidoglycan-binding domain 1 protein [Oceanimonas sp. GK1]
MYGDYFGLTDLPFSIAPDPRFLYSSQQHREALAHLQYGLHCPGGFVLLTGEVGTGKTTVCRCLLEQVPKHTELALMLSPGGSAIELLAAICQELKVAVPEQPDVRQLTNAIHHHLLESHANGRHTVLLIDEAQNLSVEQLEHIRLLTNLETNTQKLLQIMLLGQPELAETLARPELRQLSQRITARYHLTPLSFDEMRAYIAHRLSVAGIEAQLFQPASLRRLYRLTGGVPRLINVICDRALLGAFVQRLPRVDAATLNRAAVEVLGSTAFVSRRRAPAIATALLALVAGLALAGWQYRSEVSHLLMAQEAPTASAAPKPAVTAADAVLPPPAANAADSPTTPWPEIDTELSQVMAYRQLFALWQLNYDPATQPVVCRYARSRQLDCTVQNASLATLKAQNHPAVFRLERPGHPPLYATLTAIKDEQASITVGGHNLQVPLAQLEAWWPGSYVMLWQPPPRYQGPMGTGSRGEAVTWLEQRLAEWRGRPARPAQRHYDEVLSTEVRAFQRSKGLTPDGIFGPQTGIYFSASLQGSLPRLSD